MFMPPDSRLHLDPQDEYTHTPEAAGNYNESMYFNAFDTARGIGAWMRLGNRPNEGHAEMTCCVYLPDGRVGFMYGRPPISHNEAMDAGGLRFEVLEPFKRLRVSYEGELLIMDDPHAMADPGSAFKRYPKRRAAISWDEYVPRYLEEMHGAAQLWRIRDLARRVAGGATVTLLCSSACTDPARCHRTLLANLVTAAAARA